MEFKKVFIFLILFFVFFVQAAVMSPVTIYGKVISYDKNVVTLSKNDGTKIKVPKHSIVKDFKKLQSGLCVTSHASQRDIESIQQNQKEKE